ncbi:ATP-binding protein [Thermodesulfobacteriota bacterium]
MKIDIKESTIAIVGGGELCKAFLRIISGKNFEDQKIKVLGVADSNHRGEGIKFAQEKGIFTTTTYKELFKFKDLELIVELLEDDHLSEELQKTKPPHVKLITHLEAISLFDYFQIEEERIKAKKKIREHKSDITKIQDIFDQYSNRLGTIVKDRTDHLQVLEQELVESERAMSQIIQGSTIPTFVVNKYNVVTHWNKACEKLSGYSARDIVGTDRQWVPFRPEKRPIMADVIIDEMKEDDIERYYGDKWQKSVLIEGAYEAEEFFPHLGENGKWLFFTAAPIKSPDGEIIGAIETLWDKTEDRKAEEERENHNRELSALYEKYRKSEEKYRTFFDNDPNPIFIFDSKTYELLDANNRVLDYYGYSRDELLGMSFLDIGDKDDAEITTGLEKLSNGKSILFSKKRHFKKGRIPFFVNVSACHAKYGETDVIIASTTDITESIDKETQLIQAGKMTTLGVMAAGMAHEINQPLNVIQLCADYFLKMLKKGEPLKDDDLKSLANDIVANVERAAGVIKHVRDFARQPEMVRSKVDINDPIRDVFKVLGHQLKVHQIELELDLAPDMPYIMAEHNRLEQVFINLVTNAIDAMDEKAVRSDAPDSEKRLKITSFAKNGTVVVTVSDTGIGMSEAVKNKIFEPFFTTKKIGKGTGLGVSISYGIVKDYDGTIEIDSEVGKGATFKISFPCLS